MIATAATAIAIAAAGPSVGVKDDFFSPKSKTVNKGQTVTWKFQGNAPHNVVASRRGKVRFRSSTKSSGTYKKKMTRRGKYSILCTVHAPDMRMTLRVK